MVDFYQLAKLLKHLPKIRDYINGQRNKDSDKPRYGAILHIGFHSEEFANMKIEGKSPFGIVASVNMGKGDYYMNFGVARYVFEDGSLSEKKRWGTKGLLLVNFSDDEYGCDMMFERNATSDDVGFEAAAMTWKTPTNPIHKNAMSVGAGPFWLNKEGNITGGVYGEQTSLVYYDDDFRPKRNTSYNVDDYARKLIQTAKIIGGDQNF